AQVLEMDAVRAGQPRVVAGEESLDRPVRWVHAIELPDAARLLRGGELVLTTGIALPDDEGLLGNYVAELAGVGGRAAGGGGGGRVGAQVRGGSSGRFCRGGERVRAAADRFRSRNPLHLDHRGGARADH